jgi:hypothetical protein
MDNHRDVTIASTSSASTTATVNGAATITANFDQPSQTIIATMTTNSETTLYSWAETSQAAK